MDVCGSTGRKADCTVLLVQEGTTCDTLSVNQSAAEGAAQCCDGVLQGVGLGHEDF